VIAIEEDEQFLPDTWFIAGAGASAALFVAVIYYYKVVVPGRERDAAMLPRRFMNMGPPRPPPGQDEVMPSVVYRGPSYRMAGRVKQESDDDVELVPLPD
jgi:hypothetical protein